MIIRNVENYENIAQAIYNINTAKYESNIYGIITSKSKNGRTFSVRLSVHNSHGLGAKISRNRFGGNDRHVKAACWHVHGDFFEALFELEPNAIVSSAGKKVTNDEGNWQDWNVGSQMYPVQFSESCGCNSYDPD
jgi:hypothetical protein